MRFVGNYALHGLSPQTDGMPVIQKKTIVFSIAFGNHFYEIFQIDFIASLIPFKKAIIAAPTIGIPYGLNKKPNINASIPSDTSFCINEPMAAIIHISIKKYRIVVPTPSKNVRNAVNILNSRLTGNRIIFIIHLIYFSPSLQKGVKI